MSVFQQSSNLKVQEASVEDAISILALYSGESKQGDLKALKELLESTDYSFDMGSIGDLVFIALNTQIDNRTYVYTNRPDMGVFVFSLNDNSLTYQNNYWQDDEKYSIEVTKTERIPSKKRIHFRVRDYYDPKNVKIIHEDKYDEIKKSFSIEDEESLIMSSYDKLEDAFKVWREHGMSDVTLKAIQSDISELVPAKITKILELYSKNIAQKLEFSDRIFED